MVYRRRPARPRGCPSGPCRRANAARKAGNPRFYETVPVGSTRGVAGSTGRYNWPVSVPGDATPSGSHLANPLPAPRHRRRPGRHGPPDRPAPALRGGAGQYRRRLHRRRGRQAAAPGDAAAVGAGARLRGTAAARRRAPRAARDGGRVHPHRDAAARRRRRRVRAAPRAPDRQCRVRQRRVGAGRRLPLLARLSRSTGCR